MDQIRKVLKKAHKKDRLRIEETLELIFSQNFKVLNLKKVISIRGDILFRVKTGDFRIFFKWDENDIEIIDIRRRDDNTYKQF